MVHSGGSRRRYAVRGCRRACEGEHQSEGWKAGESSHLYIAAAVNEHTLDAGTTRRQASILAFSVAASVVLLYALRGGAYDIVVRQEYALAVWSVIALGFALGLLPRTRPPRLALLALGGIALLAAWTALSLLWTDSAERTFAEVCRVTGYAGILVLVISLADRDIVVPATAGLAFGAVTVCGVAVTARLAPDLLPSDQVAETFRLTRLNYPLNYWNALAAWGVISAGMALSLSASARMALTRAAWLACVPVCLLATYLTYSRQGIYGLAFVIAVAIWLSRARLVVAAHATAGVAGAAIPVLVVRAEPQIAKGTGASGAWVVVLGLLAACALCAAVAFATFAARGDQRWRLSRRGSRGLAAGTIGAVLLAAIIAHGSITQAWTEFRTDTAPASTPADDPAKRLLSFGGGRRLIWDSALEAFTSHPTLGLGAGTFEFWWNRRGGVEYLRDSHSLYLEELAELGVPGLAFTLLLLAGLVAPFARPRGRFPAVDAGTRAALAVALAGFMLHAAVDWMWEMTALGLLAVAASGLAIAWRSGPARTWAPGARAAVAALAALICVLQLPGLVSTSLVRRSQSEVRAEHFGRALANANDAIASQPWSAVAYLQRALVLETMGQLRPALEDIRVARAKEAWNWRYPLIAARINAEDGRPAAALDDVRRARMLRPRSSIFAPPGTSKTRIR